MSNIFTSNDKERDASFPFISPDDMARWKLLIRVFLQAKDVYKSLQSEMPRPNEEDLIRTLDENGEETSASEKYRKKYKKKAKKWRAKDAIAVAYLVKACMFNPTAMTIVQDNPEVTATELMTLLEQRFDLQDLTGVIQTKLADFNSLTMDDKETLEAFTTRILVKRLELNGLGCDYITNDLFGLGRLKEALLQTERFHELGLSLKTIPDLTWDRAIHLCTGYEKSMTGSERDSGNRKRGREENGGNGGIAGTGNTNTSEVVKRLKVKFNKKFKSLKEKYKQKDKKDSYDKNIECAKCGKKGHQARNCRSTGTDKRSCFNCGKSGHIKPDCPDNKEGGKSKKDKWKKSTHFDNDFSDSDTCNMLSERRGKPARQSTKINMDSGATSHMVPQNIADKVADKNLRPQQRTIDTAKQGVSFASTHRGRLGKMEETLITENGVLSEPIASVARFDLDGKFVLFGGGMARLLNSDLEMEAEAPLGTDMAYRFDMSDLTGDRALLGNAAPPEDLNLWHKRLGHRNKRDLGHAIKQKLLKGPKPTCAVNKQAGLCDPCTRAKSTRRSFARAVHSGKEELKEPRVLKPLVAIVEEVVTDLKGPISVPGPKGENYIQLYTEVDTKWRTAKCMATKSAAYINTKDFITKDLASEGQKLLQLHSDGAPELISKETVQLLASENCRVTYSPSYTPENNGLAERSNRTIWDSAYTMWLACSLPAMYWVYAVYFALTCTNMLPTNTTKGWMSPFEAKYGTAPDVSRFRIFGCISYVHVPQQLRDSTFADKSYKGFFVGFTWPLLDRYLVFVPELDKVVESTHVNFDEVTSTHRKTEELLVVDTTRRVLKDFAFLSDMAYTDDENGVLYVTTRVATSRGFIVTYRAPISNGRRGQEEPHPIHAKDVEQMLRTYWSTHEPMMWSDNVLTRVCNVMQGAPGGRPEQSDQLPQTPDLAVAALPRGGFSGAGADGPRVTPASVSGMSPSVGEERSTRVDPASVSGMSPSVGEGNSSERRSRRERVQRQPTNVGKLGNIDVTNAFILSDMSERACYMAVRSIVDEADDKAECWIEPKVKELKSLVLEHNSWEIVPLPSDRKAISARWVVKEKTQPHRKLKARFTPRGFAQQEGIDYNETFAPVAKLCTLRVFLTLVAILCLQTCQLDVTTAFLHATLEEEIYVKPIYDQVDILIRLFKTLSEGWQKSRVAKQIKAIRNGGVMLLKKAVYGLKQAPREWWKRLNKYLTQHMGFIANKYDVCFYTKHLAGGAVVLLLLYVDDIILAASTSEILSHYSALLANEFKMGDEGPLTTYLGFDISINLKAREVKLCMKKFVEKCYKRFKLEQKQSVCTPLPDGIMGALHDAVPADEQYAEDFLYREKIGCLLYYMICMRYDICFAVGLMAKFSNKISKVATAGVTQMWHYCYNTRAKCLILGGISAYITAFSDSDWAGDKIDRKSYGSYVVYLGRGPIDWGSKQQRLVAQSTAEAEFIAMTAPAKTIQWLRWLLHQTKIESIITKYSSTLFVDNTAAIAIASNPIASERTKHVALKYKMIQELSECGVVSLEHIATDLNVADIGTKALGKRKFQTFANTALGQEEFTRPTKRKLTEVSDEFV